MILGCSSRLMWFMLAALFAMGSLRAAETPGRASVDSQTSGPPIELRPFRRVYVPANRPDEWPTAGERYLPIARDEFARLLDDAQAGQRAAPGVLAARVSRADYTATLEQGELLVGRALLEIVHNSAQPALLLLDPWSVAVASARWQAADTIPETSFDKADSAVVGNTSDGAFAVLVPRSGRLMIAWSLRGQRNLAGTVGFPLRLPQTASGRLVLEAPADVVPVFDRALVAELPQPAKETRRWNLETGGRACAQLRFTTRSAHGQKPELTLLRQADRYQISPHGVDLACVMQIDAHGDALSQLTLQVDPTLQIVSVRKGSQNLTWTTATDQQRNFSRTRISLPEAISGAGEKIEITAIAPVTVGELWRLPRIRCEGVFWQEGNMSLAVRSPFALNRIESEGARQVKSTPLASAAGEEIDLQCFSPDATLDIDVDRPEDRLEVDCGTRLEFFTGEMVAHVTADFRLVQGEQGTLTCQVSPLWQIDGVEAQEPASVADWDIEGADPGRRLIVRLASPATTTAAVRLKVSGRRVLSLHDTMSMWDLAMLRFDSAARVVQQVLLQDPDAFDLLTTGREDLTILDLATLSVDSPLYVDPMPRGLAFAVDSATDRLGVTLTPRKPQFTAKIELSAEVRGGSLTEVCRIRCQPSGVSMDRLRVHMSQQPPGMAWQWSTKKTLGTLATRRLTADERIAAGAGIAGQAWEVSWRVPQREVFEIQATRKSPWKTKTALCLLAAPEAASQTGELVIRATDATGVEIVNRRLTAVPSAAETSGGVPTVRGKYRFDPTRDGFSDESAIEIGPATAAAEETGAWAWSCELDSRLSAAGLTSHLAVFRLQTAGQQRVQFHLPEASRLHGAWVDSAAVSSQPGSSRTVTVNLPAGREFATVSLSFASPESLPALATYYAPNFPTTNIPVMKRRWRVWLPSGYQLPTSDPSAHNYTVQRLTWPQRLFGPLARGENGASRNPLRADFWLPDRKSAREIAEARKLITPLIEKLGTLWGSSGGVAGDSAAGALVWGDALKAMVATLKNADLRVSRSSLCDSGIDANTALPVVKERGPMARGAAMLRRAHLVLLVRGQHVLVASSTLAALNHNASTPVADLPAYLIGDGPLAGDMEGDASHLQPLEMVSVDGWLLEGANRWLLPEIVVSSLRETRGWKAYEFSMSDESAVLIAIQNVSAMRVTGAATLVAVFSAGLCGAFARRPWWMLVCGLTCAAAWLAPVAWTPVTSAMLVGAAASVLWMARRRPRTVPCPAEDHSAQGSTRRVLMGTSAILLLMGWSWFASQSWAQETTSDMPSHLPASDVLPPVQSRAAVAKVLVSIDDAQRIVGENVHVPETFYRLLLQDAARVRAVPKGWLLTGARYRVSLNREGVHPEDNSLKLHVGFDLQVFIRDTIVRIPLADENLLVADGSIQVDGRPARRLVSPPHEIVLQIDEPGTKRIEFTIMPDLQVVGTVVGFEVDVPAVSGAQVDLSGVDPAQVEIPTAQGRIVIHKEQDRVVADLGGARRLIVRWPQRAGAEGAAPAFEVDDLQWAHLQPGSMVVDVHLNVRVSEGRVRQLRLLVDPRMRLISSTAKDSPLVSTRVVPGDPQTIDLELARPIVDQGVVKLGFVVAGTSGVGNVRMPRCEVAGVRATRRWFAVSVDSGLEFKQELGQDVQPLAIHEFAAAWDDNDAKPQSAFRMPRGEVLWSLSTQPKATTSKVEETLVLGIGPRSTTVRWLADVNRSAGFDWQRHIKAPPGLSVESVVVIGADDTELSSRWSRNSRDGSLTVQFDAPITGEHRIVVDGRLPHAIQDSLSMPKLSLQGAQSMLRRLLVFRHPFVLATLRPVGHWTALTSPPKNLDTSGLGSQIAALSTSHAEDLAEIMIQPNQPIGTATQVVTASHAAGVWLADVDFRLQVQSGLVDSIAFDIPRQWESPVLAEPIVAGATVSVSEIPGQSGRRLVVRLAEPVSDALQVVLRGKLGTAERDRLRVPDIVPLGSAKVERIVLLPRRMELQPISWDTSGLDAAELPAELKLDPQLAESHSAYRVLGDRFQASLRLIGQSLSQPRVELSETWMDWEWDGRCFGAASLALAPSGLQSCILEMPASFRIIHGRVDGVPVRIAALDRGRWRVPLLEHQAPQMVELVFQGRLATRESPGADTSINGPHLAGLEVARTLWTMTGPSQAAIGLPINASPPNSPAKDQQHRMQATANENLSRQMPAVMRNMTSQRPMVSAMPGNNNAMRLKLSAPASGDFTARAGLAIGTLMLCAVVAFRWPQRELPRCSSALIGLSIATACWLWLDAPFVAPVLLCLTLLAAIRSARHFLDNAKPLRKPLMAPTIP